MTALRYLLSAVAGCAAPLWCAVRGHGPWYVVSVGGGNDGWTPVAAEQCRNCGKVRR